MTVRKHITRLQNYLRWLNSFFSGRRVAIYQSSFNGTLEVWFLNGKLVLNSKNANQSYDSLHRIFQKIFKRIELARFPPARVLLLGIGGGSVIRILREELQISAPLVAVDHDPLMLEIARKYFKLDQHHDVEIVNIDAYDYVSRAKAAYDLIIVDLFKDDKVPLKFYEPAFHSHLLSLLPGGRIIFNAITKDISHFNHFEKLGIYYRSLPGLLVNSYQILEDNEVMVIERK